MGSSNAIGGAASRPQQRDVAASSQVPERGRLVVDVAELTVGIFRMDGQLHAYQNICPHQGGPVCQGTVIPCVTEVVDESRASKGFAFNEADMHIVCPWHGYEFSIANGQHAGKPGIRLMKVAVEEKGGRIYVAV